MFYLFPSWGSSLICVGTSLPMDQVPTYSDGTYSVITDTLEDQLAGVVE